MTLPQAGVHILRHTFCSHLSPAATEDAIRLVDTRLVGLDVTQRRGDIVETSAVGSESG